MGAMCPPAPGRSHDLGLPAPPARARLRAPVSDSRIRYDTLAYLDAHDGVSGEDHAFLAYKETELTSGLWRVRVRSLQTAGGVFEPLVMEQQAQAAAAQGLPYFTWGYQLAPGAADPRQIEFRVHVRDGRPVRLELYARLRRADHSPAVPCAVVCDWP